MCFFYILYNKSIDRYYTGSTNNIERRLKEHNERRRNRYTENRKGSWTLVHLKEFESLLEARRYERKVKKQKSRNYIENLIKNSQDAPVAQWIEQQPSKL